MVAPYEAVSGVEQIESAKTKGIRFIQLQFTDIIGVVKAVTIPVHQLEGSVRHGTARGSTCAPSTTPCLDMVRCRWRRSAVSSRTGWPPRSDRTRSRTGPVRLTPLTVVLPRRTNRGLRPD